MKTTVHIVSHSHWDREWYLPFEKHRNALGRIGRCNFRKI